MSLKGYFDFTLTMGGKTPETPHEGNPIQLCLNLYMAVGTKYVISLRPFEPGIDHR